MLTDPFPHMVIDGLFSDELLAKVAAEIPHPDDQRWRRFHGPLEGGKSEGGEGLWGDATRALATQLASPEMVQWLAHVMEIDLLRADFLGGGYHLIEPGGRLKIHSDFNVHPHDRIARKLNLLVFLNEDWIDEWGGHLELWDVDMQACVRRIAPVMNRTVIFQTSAHSWHGHPDPLPAPVPRRSFACYYYGPGEVEREQSTVFVHRPGENFE